MSNNKFTDLESIKKYLAEQFKEKIGDKEIQEVRITDEYQLACLMCVDGFHGPLTDVTNVYIDVPSDDIWALLPPKAPVTEFEGFLEEALAEAGVDYIVMLWDRHCTDDNETYFYIDDDLDRDNMSNTLLRYFENEGDDTYDEDVLEGMSDEEIEDLYYETFPEDREAECYMDKAKHGYNVDALSNEDILINSRETFKEAVKRYIEKNGKPSMAFYYDGCELTFSYYNKATEKEVLCGKTFEFWEKNVMVGKHVVAEAYSRILDELEILAPVCSMQDFESDEDDEF